MTFSSISFMLRRAMKIRVLDHFRKNKTRNIICLSATPELVSSQLFFLQWDVVFQLFLYVFLRALHVLRDS